jgi:uncharacterized protein YegJ (DUF2314 family)
MGYLRNGRDFMNTIIHRTLGALLLAAISGCGESGDGNTVVRRKGQPDMVRVKDDDAKMNVAIEKARATVQEFVAALKSPKPGESGFAIKKPFVISGTNAEHIWLSEVSYDGKVFHGRVNNDPVDVKGIKLGDPATVSPSELSDWMFIRKGKLAGGETIRVLYDLSSPAGRKKFEAETGLKAD